MSSAGRRRGGQRRQSPRGKSSASSPPLHPLRRPAGRGAPAPRRCLRSAAAPARPPPPPPRRGAPPPQIRRARAPPPPPPPQLPSRATQLCRHHQRLPTGTPHAIAPLLRAGPPPPPPSDPRTRGITTAAAAAMTTPPRRGLSCDPSLRSVRSCGSCAASGRRPLAWSATGGCAARRRTARRSLRCGESRARARARAPTRRRGPSAAARSLRP
jgi:hypothetical protein